MVRSRRLAVVALACLRLAAAAPALRAKKMDRGLLKSASHRGGALAVRAAAAADAAAEAHRVSLATSTMLLVKNNIGFSSLTLASAAVGNGIGTTVLVIALTVWMSSYGFELMGQACDATKSRQRQAGRGADDCTLASISSAHGLRGSGFAWEAGVVVYSWVVLVCYVPFLAGTIQPLLSNALEGRQSAALAWRVLRHLATSRRDMKLAICGCIFLPLSFLTSFKGVMAAVCTLGNFSALYFVAFSLVRSFDGSYAAGGRFFNGAPVVIPTGLFAVGAPARLLDLVWRVSFASSCHYASPRYHAQLRNPTMPRFRRMARIAYASLAAFYCLVAIVGSRTFGQKTAALVLENYAVDDPLAVVARWLYIVVALSIYPLIFSNAARALHRAVKRNFGEQAPYVSTVVLPFCFAIFAAALRYDDVGKLASFAGSFFVPFFALLLPGALAIMRSNQANAKRGRRFAVACAMPPLGLCLVFEGLRRMFFSSSAH
ncbi:transmembrane amino acid transporter protein-domain-containing protein [Pelagophyceae sp. CCMP2097]|nr:transmembrane amino acid transporter protein-domain-containing protein [Pelagophyceae sp. CCMP2097]